MNGGVPINLPGLRAQFAVRRPRDAEVDDLRPVLGEQHVARLEIPVDDADPVDVAQRLGEPGHQPAQLGGRHAARSASRARTSVGPGMNRVAIQGRSASGIGVHDGRGERPADPPGGRHLLPETRP